MAFSILTFIFAWGNSLLEVIMDDCCNMENTQLQRSVINDLYTMQLISCLFNITCFTRTVRKRSFFPTKLTKACSVLCNLQLILTKRDWENFLFLCCEIQSCRKRTSVYYSFRKKEASVMIAKKDSLAHLMMCKILVKGWKYSKLHLNFSRKNAKIPVWIYSGHLQGYSKETKLILELARLCKFIII